MEVLLLGLVGMGFGLWMHGVLVLVIGDLGGPGGDGIPTTHSVVKVHVL